VNSHERSVRNVEDLEEHGFSGLEGVFVVVGFMIGIGGEGVGMWC
jgi:hypothetical protein